MATIWLATASGIRGDDPFRETTVAICVARLGLRKGQFIKSLSPMLRFIAHEPSAERAVVRIDKGEARGWRAGYYLLALTPCQVVRRFGV